MGWVGVGFGDGGGGKVFGGVFWVGFLEGGELGGVNVGLVVWKGGVGEGGCGGIGRIGGDWWVLLYEWGWGGGSCMR